MRSALARIGGTPVARVHAAAAGRQASVLLKLEEANPTGSVKDRTAAGLVADLARTAPLGPGTTVVESTSGNLGLAMADVLGRLGCRFIAVIDPKTPHLTREALRRAGAEVVLVDEPDSTGGYLLSRLRRVRELLAANPDYRWPDQYANPANPKIHEETTGPEILAAAGADLSAVYAPVSTGGTLAGVATYLRRRAEVRIVAIDAQASLVTGERAGPRLITGIGASRRSSFLRPELYDRSIAVPDAEAFAMCRLLRADTGLLVGGSSGCALAGWWRDFVDHRPAGLSVCLCPDGGQAYLDTIYADEWLADNEVRADVDAALRRLRAAGVGFTLATKDRR